MEHNPTAATASGTADLRHRTSLSSKSIDLSRTPSNGSINTQRRASSTSISLNGHTAAKLDKQEQYPPSGEATTRLLEEEEESLEMGRGSAYSSLPTTGSAYNARAGRPRSGLKAWQRNALIAAGILLVVGFFASRGSSPSSFYPSGGATPAQIASKDWQDNAVEAIETGVSAQPTRAKQTGKLSSTKQDGKCVLADGTPEISYALMIDAGSTGSRIHVYKFSNCLPEGAKPGDKHLPELQDEIFLAIQPGLSSFKGKPREAAESLRELMDAAMKGVPESERSCTPIAVKATAGLRLLGAKESQEILDYVESWLKKEWPFHVVDNGVTIMDGKDEGVYAWITINYLLGLVGPGKDKGASAAVMDLGGASTQIVFEPSFPSNSKLSPGDHVYDLNFASTDHTLYQHSHLGYGLMQARRSVHNLVAFTHVWQSVTKSGKAKEWDDLTVADQIPSPCLVKGGKKVVTLDPPGRKTVEITLVGTGAGFDACRRVVDVTMAKDALCDVEPCAFGGVYQPKLMETFGSGPIYALSYFYDRIVPLGLGKDSAPFTIGDLRKLSTDVCAGSKGWSRFKGNKEAMAELEDRPEYCLDLSFMYSLLSLGYELAEERELVTGKKINDVELGWALGAGIALLEHSSLQCRNPDN